MSAWVEKLAEIVPAGGDPAIQERNWEVLRTALELLQDRLNNPPAGELSDIRDDLGLGALAVLDTVDTAEVDDEAITYAKMQHVSATDKLLGRETAGAGDVEEIACTAAGRALLDDADAAAQRTTLGVGVDVSDKVYELEVTVGAEAGNTRSITMQVKDGAGNNVSEEFLIEWWLSDSATGWISGTSMGTVTYNAGVQMNTPTPKTNERLVTDGNGAVDIDFWFAAARTWYLRVEMNGRVYTNNCSFA